MRSRSAFCNSFLYILDLVDTNFLFYTTFLRPKFKKTTTTTV